MHSNLTIFLLYALHLTASSFWCGVNASSVLGTFDRRTLEICICMFLSIFQQILRYNWQSCASTSVFCAENMSQTTWFGQIGEIFVAFLLDSTTETLPMLGSRIFSTEIASNCQACDAVSLTKTTKQKRLRAVGLNAVKFVHLCNYYELAECAAKYKIPTYLLHHFISFPWGFFSSIMSFYDFAALAIAKTAGWLL